MEIIDTIRKNQLFNDLSNEEIQSIAGLATVKTVPKNTFVFSEGDSASSFYMIKEGRVNVTVTNEDGKELILSTLQAGDNFGELSIIDDNPRSANIFTLENCIFIILQKNDFYQILKQNPVVGINMIKSLCQRIRFITSIAHDLALLDIYGRLVKLLLENSTMDDSGQRTVTMPLTQQEIASRLGGSREMVNQILNALKKGGYLSVENKIITIKQKLPPAY